MRLSKEEYNRVIEILKRYNYNCVNILAINNDITSINATRYDSLPSGTNNIIDITLNKVIKLDENKELRKSINEYQIVKKALMLVSKDAKTVFEEEFQKMKSKWEVISILNTSEETYKRRKRELIYTTYEILKK